jgi:hypothetical protein
MNTPTPKNVPKPVDIPDEEQFEEFLEWTQEEEEFLHIMDNQKDNES